MVNLFSFGCHVIVRRTYIRTYASTDCTGGVGETIKRKGGVKKFIWNMLCLCATQLKFWLQTDLGRENSARQGRQLPLTFLTMVTRWSRSTSNFYALIGQNLTGEFMRKIYAASWILFTLIAEADRVLSQLVMFLTVFFHWMCKMKFSCYQESSVIHG